MARQLADLTTEADAANGRLTAARRREKELLQENRRSRARIGDHLTKKARLEADGGDRAGLGDDEYLPAEKENQGEENDRSGLSKEVRDLMRQ